LTIWSHVLAKSLSFTLRQKLQFHLSSFER
jgi:hypothetical protein